jgi:hypothetical protein
MSVRSELPHPAEAAEEPIRPLLAVVERALDALEVALQVEGLEGDTGDPDPDRLPPELGRWTAEILASQIDAMRSALYLYTRALRHRNAIRPAPPSSLDVHLF